MALSHGLGSLQRVEHEEVVRFKPDVKCEDVTWAVVGYPSLRHEPASRGAADARLHTDVTHTAGVEALRAAACTDRC